MVSYVAYGMVCCDAGRNVSRGHERGRKHNGDDGTMESLQTQEPDVFQSSL